MQTKQFYSFVVKILIFGLVFAGALSFVLYNRGPHVRFAAFDSNINETFLTLNHTLTLNFDRPIEQVNYSNSVSFEPFVETEVTTKEQSIVVTFKQSLRSGSTYNLTLSPDIVDKAGKKMKEQFNYSFETPEPKYVYLQRNYGIDRDTAKDSDDKIIAGEVGSDNEEELFSAPVIRSFAANSDYLVVATIEDDGEDRITIVNLETKEVSRPRLALRGSIGNLSLSSRGRTVLFTTQLDPQRVSQEYYQEFLNRLHSLDLETEELTVLTNDRDDPLSAQKVSFSVDGQVALIRNEILDYYAVSPFNDYSPVLLGSYTEDYGFNDEGNGIILRNGNDIFSYDLASSSIDKLDFDNSELLQDINLSNGVLKAAFVDVDFDFDSQLYTSSSEIVSIGSDGNKQQIWSDDGKSGLSLQNFDASFDSKYLSMQLKTEDCKFDAIVGNSQCREVRTLLYDANSMQEVGEVQGFGLTWLP